MLIVYLWVFIGIGFVLIIRGMIGLFATEIIYRRITRLRNVYPPFTREWWLINQSSELWRDSFAILILFDLTRWTPRQFYLESHCILDKIES